MINFTRFIQKTHWAYFIALLFFSTCLQAQTHLVKDISKSPSGMTDGMFNPMEIVESNGVVFFTAATRTYGVELWKTNGTAEGTTLVKDIVAGSESSQPSQLVAVNGVLYFSANDNLHGRELWKSDGTAEGTVMVKDIYANGWGSPSNLTNAGTFLLFSVNDGVNGMELWRSDGTEAGTSMVKDIAAGSNYSFPQQLVNINGTVYFSASDAVNGYELWKTDGTEAGTVLVKDIRPAQSSNPDHLTNVNGVLYFDANDGNNGQELWKSDGTSAGTVLVKDMETGGAGSYPQYLTNVNGTLYMVAHTSASGSELWKSDGTSAGTVMVKDINPGNGNGPFILDHMTAINSTIFFAAYTTATGVELWKSDGTAAGTVMVKDFLPGVNNGLPQYLTNLNGKLYFSANGGPTGIELWMSDGTESGTVLFKDINPAGTSSPEQLVNLSGRLYFLASDGTHGKELWKMDGTPASTVMVKDISSGNTGSQVGYRSSESNGNLTFIANDGVPKLWKTDGTEAGTNVLVDRVVDSQFVMNGTTYFTGYDDNGKFRLWKIDNAGNQVTLGPAFITINNYDDITAVGNTIYFQADDGVNGTELWKTDGTDAGTVLVKDIRPGAGSSIPSAFINVNGVLYFQANNGTNGTELWKCDDGTAAGTIMVKDLWPGTSSGNPYYFVSFNGALYFAAANDQTGGNRALWKSDGSTAGTTIVKDVQGVAFLTVFNDKLFFWGYDPTHGLELWKSDGTTAGTEMVKDIYEGPESSYPDQFIVVNGTLYFTAQDAIHGNELWKSDGTAEGTVLVKDIVPGVVSSKPYSLFSYDNKLFFVTGSRLWKSEGGECNTVPLTNEADVIVTDWMEFKIAGNKLYFVGITEATGDELFYYDFSNVNTPGCTQTITFNALDAKTYGDASFDLGATASSGLDVSYVSSDPAIATVNGNKVTIVGAGEVTITASQAGDKNYAAASEVQQKLVINKAAATLALSELTQVYSGVAKNAVVTTTPAGLTGVEITYKNGGTSVQPVDVGSYAVTASLVNNNYTAEVVTGTLVITKANQSITFASLDAKAYGDSFDLTASASSGLAVVFSSSNANVATINGNKVTIVGTGTCTITATQSGNNNYAAATAVERTLTAKSADLKLIYNGTEVSSLTLAYDKVLKSTNSALKFTIKNKGDLSLSIIGMSYPTGYSVDKTTATLAPGESTEITVTLSPTVAQDYNGVLEITSNVNIGALTGKTTVALTGKGVLITGVEGNGVFGSELAQVYPNPSKDVFKIKILSDEAMEQVAFQMVSSTGEQIAVNFNFEGDKTYAVDLNGKATGLYYLIVQSKGERSVFKLLKY